MILLFKQVIFRFPAVDFKRCKPYLRNTFTNQKTIDRFRYLTIEQIRLEQKHTCSSGERMISIGYVPLPEDIPNLLTNVFIKSRYKV